MTTRARSSKVTAQLQSRVEQVRRQIEATVRQSGQRLDEVRRKAADAALQWVLAHDERVSAFRRSVQGTPIEKAFEALLELLRTQAGSKTTARKGAARKSTARRRPAAKKARKR
jgi:hypothetical protein